MAEGVRLSELVVVGELGSRRRGSLYSLGNSLRRNTLYGECGVRREEMGYDCRLPRMALRRKDLTKMLQLLLGKQEMTLPDRNLLRRLLLDVFPEELVCAGSRQFVTRLRLQEQRPGEQAVPQQRLFYFVLRGAAEVTSGGFTYLASEGGTFGQLQLLSGESIEHIRYLERTVMLTLEDGEFESNFREHFERKYGELLSHVGCIHEKYLQEVPRINRLFLLNHLRFQTFSSGDKIVEAAKPATRIYFVGSRWRGEAPAGLLDGCLGLKEALRGKETYLESAYSLDFGFMLPFVEREHFLKYVKDFLSPSNSAGKSLLHTRTLLSNPEAGQSVAKLMSLKRVRFQARTKKKVLTQPCDTIVTDFKFLRPVREVVTSKHGERGANLANLMFKNRKSQSIHLKSIL